MARVPSPGRAATADQSGRPWTPPTSGSRHTVVAAPWAWQWPTRSATKSTRQSWRKASTSGVSSAGMARPPVPLGPTGLAVAAAAAPAGRVEAEVLGVDPVRLVPEDVVGAGVDGRVGPGADEGPHGRVVGAAGRGRPAVVQHLAGVGVEGGEAALGLAAEQLGHPPGGDLHLQPGVVGDGHDPAHALAVVGEVVLGVGVQHPGEPVGGQPLHVGGDMPEDPVAEVGNCRRFHPFTAPAVRPLTTRRWTSRKNTTAGMANRVDPAITPPHSVPWLVVKEASQIPRVCFSGLRSST